MTYTEDDVERVAKVQSIAFGLDWEKMSEESYNAGITDHLCRDFWRVMARDVLAAIPSPAMAVLQETRDACAAACRVIAEAGLSERLEAELAKAGVKTGFGARMDAALAAMPDGRAAVIEECAKVSETMAANIRRLHGEKFYHVKIGSLLMCCDEIAQNIRALKAQPASPGSGE